jgi:hypothetical protein
MANLIGLHDREATALAVADSWIVDTVALSENPVAPAYDPRFRWLVRLNFGYGSTGTLPAVGEYDDFAARVARYVAGSTNCTRWIIGNEPNLSREWPEGEPIYPWNYAACFKKCREAIRALPGHERDEVLVAASGPWNAELKYEVNPNGDWVIYFGDQLEWIGDGFDGVALHAYTHGYDVGLVSSEAVMNAPFDGWHYEFRCYRDYLWRMPEKYDSKLIYMTEANGNGEWQAVGLMPAMLGEIEAWNAGEFPQVNCVCMFRYPDFDDGFAMVGHDDVMAEYHTAARAGYESPAGGAGVVLPPVDAGDGIVEDGLQHWDPALDLRGTDHLLGEAAAGEYVWRVIVGDYFPPGDGPGEAQGRVNTFLTVVDENDHLLSDVRVRWFWADGEEMKVTTVKSDPWLGGEYSLDFSMYEGAPAYGFEILEDASDIIWGLGLGSVEHRGSKEHCAYYFKLQRQRQGVAKPPVIVEPPYLGPLLIWPVAGEVTQWFGENPDRYVRFGEPGHNGIDIACPVGTPVRAVSAGEVMFAGWDENYGWYMRLWHAAIESHAFYAHLDELAATVGDAVGRGDVVARSGNSGNSSGPHLHFELRGGTREGNYFNVTAGYGKGRYNPTCAYAITGSPLSPGAEK